MTLRQKAKASKGSGRNTAAKKLTTRNFSGSIMPSPGNGTGLPDPSTSVRSGRIFVEECPEKSGVGSLGRRRRFAHPSLSLSLCLSHTHAHTHTHTHTHTLSFSLFFHLLHLHTRFLPLYSSFSLSLSLSLSLIFFGRSNSYCLTFDGNIFCLFFCSCTLVFFLPLPSLTLASLSLSLSLSFLGGGSKQLVRCENGLLLLCVKWKTHSCQDLSFSLSFLLSCLLHLRNHTMRRIP